MTNLTTFPANIRFIILLALSSAVLSGCTSTSGQDKQADLQAGSAQARLLRVAKQVEARGETGTALALYERAAEMSGSDAGSHTRVGTARLKSGDLAGAEQSFRSALAINPQDGNALVGLGTAQLQQDEPAAAARSFAAAAPIVKTVSVYNKLGTAYVLSGNTSAAESAFSSALALQPGNLDTKTNLALAQAISNNETAASSTMQSVVGSPLAEQRHFINYVIILSMGGNTAAARAVDIPDMPTNQKNQILTKAAKLKSIQDPAKRAQAVGLLASV